MHVLAVPVAQLIIYSYCVVVFADGFKKAYFDLIYLSGPGCQYL